MKIIFANKFIIFLICFLFFFAHKVIADEKSILLGEKIWKELHFLSSIKQELED